jgi:hypothetical protein
MSGCSVRRGCGVENCHTFFASSFSCPPAYRGGTGIASTRGLLDWEEAELPRWKGW